MEILTVNFVSGVCPSLAFNPPQNPFYSLDFLLDPLTDDLIINPDGTYGMASGSLKLQQDIKLFLLSPLGTSFIDGQWGNPAINLIGTAPVSVNSITSTIRGALVSLQRYKQQEQQVRGYALEGTEVISSIIATSIQQVQSDGNAFNVLISCVDGSSGSQNINVLLS